MVLHVRNTVTMILHEEYLSKDTNMTVITTMRMTTNRQRQRKIFIVMMMVKKFTIMMGSSMRIIVTVMERPQHNATMHDTRALSNLKT